MIRQEKGTRYESEPSPGLLTVQSIVLTLPLIRNKAGHCSTDARQYCRRDMTFSLLMNGCWPENSNSAQKNHFLNKTEKWK